MKSRNESKTRLASVTLLAATILTWPFPAILRAVQNPPPGPSAEAQQQLAEVEAAAARNKEAMAHY